MTQKKINKWSMVLFGVIVLFACSKGKEEPPVTNEPYLTIIPVDTISFPPEGGTVTLEVVTSYDEWSVLTADWCTVTTIGNQLTLTASHTEDARSALLTVSSGAGESLVTASITINQAGLPVYKITIPTDFTTGDVQKVLASGQKIAEISNEYIRTTSTSPIDERMIVVYPVVNGNTDLTKGFAVKDGGLIAWNLEDNTCAYTQGSETTPLQSVYMKNGVLTITGSADAESTTISADLLIDTRGAKSDAYKVVKIGTQYWMAENLRAENYRDGTPIPNIMDDGAWNSDENGAYRYLYNSPVENKVLFGALYNGYAMYNAAGLAPEGWIVPSDNEWGKLRSYIGIPYGRKLAATQYWNTGNLKATGITGFAAMPGGFFSSVTGYSGDFTETWWWSTTKKRDLLLKKDLPIYYRIVYSSSGMPTDTHEYIFGHSIRCVREK
jgi:uncharacterized protein (TIGR02145 family)